MNEEDRIKYYKWIIRRDRVARRLMIIGSIIIFIVTIFWVRVTEYFSNPLIRIVTFTFGFGLTGWVSTYPLVLYAKKVERECIKDQ
jgi:hypothetical protein